MPPCSRKGRRRVGQCRAAGAELQERGDEPSTHALTAREAVLRLFGQGEKRVIFEGANVDGWEVFFSHYPHIISAIEAFGTVSAVIVSLALALGSQRKSRTRIKAYAQTSTMRHRGLGDLRPRYVTVDIQNTGLHPVSIPFSFFYWRVPLQWEEPFSRRGWLVTPWDYSQEDPLVPQKHYPVEISPRSSESFFLADIETFRQNFIETFATANRVQRFRFRFLQARVMTADNKVFSVKIGASIRREIRSLLDSVP